MEKVGGTVEALEGLGETLRDTSDLIRTGLLSPLLSFGALMVGLKTGISSLLHKIFIKRR